MTVGQITLNDSNHIPQLGFGVFKIPPDETAAAVRSALEIGYRHIDTATAYGNEAEVGAALKATGLAGEVYVTTKLWNADQGFDSTLQAFDASMDRLGLDVLDLYLIHWPLPEHDRFVDTYRAFAQVKEEGRVRSIGVSNFRVPDLQRLEEAGLPTPAVNQIELHPYLTQAELTSYGREHGIVTEAWSPLAQGKVLDDEVIASIARTHDADPGQVVLAWQLAQGHVVFPKSVTPERIASNFASTQISLTDEEIGRISALNRDERIGPDPADFHVT